MNTWYVGDPHLDHLNKRGTGVIDYCDRPFDDIKKMNEVIMDTWNRYVKPKDKVKILGDFCFSHPQYFLDKLNGKFTFIVGDHDRSIAYIERHPKVEKVTYIDISKIGKIYLTCCHWCMRVWPKSHFNSWHLYAHSHGGLPPIGKSFDVGVDNIYKHFGEFRPINVDEVTKIMDRSPDNFNFIKKKKTIDKKE